MTTLLAAPVRPAVPSNVEVVTPQPKKVVQHTPKSNGRDAEASFQALLDSPENIWFKQVQEYPDMDFMFSLAAEYHAAKLNSVLEKTGGSFTTLEELGPKAFMDLVFKVDYLLEYRDNQGRTQRVGIDLTCDSRKVKEKEIEISRKKATLSKLEVNRTCVVLWNLKPDKPQYTKIPLLQAVRDRLASNHYFCNTVILF
jgi:hypothetical protein